MNFQRWQRIGLISVAFAISVPCGTGCESLSNTAKGGLVGGGLGAGAGALIGGASGHAGRGALIGGLAGTAVGGLVGNEKDQQEKKQEQAKLAALQQAAAKPPLTIDDVVALASSGTLDNIIITQIRTTGSTYTLTAGDLQYLQSKGVSNAVISEMQTARRPQTVIVRPQPDVVYIREPRPVYYVPAPPPPPPPGFSVGVGFGR